MYIKQTTVPARANTGVVLFFYSPKTLMAESSTIFQGKKRYIDRTRCAKKLNSWRRRVPKKTVFVVVPDFPHIIHTLDSLHFRHNMATPLDFTKSQTYLGPKGMPGLCTIIIVVLVKKWFLFCYVFRLSLYGCYKVFVEFRFWTLFESET